MTTASFRPGYNSRQAGFTLMEVLIAVAITAVIGLGVWQVISGIILSRDRVDEVADEFDQLQHAFLMIERDLGQVVNRPVRNMYGDSEPALTSMDDDFSLQLTRQGWRNPLGIKRSELQRVGYEFIGDELRRRYWLTLDQGQEDNSRDQLILSNVEAFDIRFMDANKKWVKQWPTQEALNSVVSSGGVAAIANLPMPAAVEITLTHQRYGELKRLFPLPVFSARGAQQMINQGSVLPETDAAEDEDEAEATPDESVE